MALSGTAVAKRFAKLPMKEMKIAIKEIDRIWNEQ